MTIEVASGSFLFRGFMYATEYRMCVKSSWGTDGNDSRSSVVIMPRWDKTRDYYADLELPSTASVEDAKKQFRKLALRWHPDRNPGRESEVNSKFQTIQSAHEILSDPTQKREYDEARKAYNSRYPKASGVRGNPWQDIGKQYQPPPTRNTTQKSSSKTHSGAHRYESFTNNMPRTPKPNPRDDPQARRAYADAWENMRSNSSRRGGPSTPGRAPTSAARDTKASDSESAAPRSAYQQQKAQAAFGARRNGFTPRSPGMADEPPVTGKNYFTTRSHSNIFSDAEDNKRPSNESASTSIPVDPLSQFREKVWDKRQSTPYHTPGGEKTSLFNDGPGIGRSASTRSPLRPEMPGTFPQTRPRSSTSKSSDNDGGSEDSTNYGRGAGGASTRQTTNGANTSHPRPSDRYKPSAEPKTVPQPRPETNRNTPTTSTNASKSGGNPAQTTNGPSVYGTPSTHKPSNIPTQKQHHNTSANGFKDTKAGQPDCKNPPVFQSNGQTDSQSHTTTQKPSSEDVQREGPRLFPLEEQQMDEIFQLLGIYPERRQKNNTDSSKTRGHHHATPTSTKKFETGTNYSWCNSFSFSAGNDTPSRNASAEGLARNSTDSINTRFVEDEAPEQWTFCAGPGWTKEPQTPTKGRPQSRSRSRRQVPKPRPTETDHMPSMQEDTGNASGQGFFAGVWNDKIGSQHFEPQPSRSTSNSPTRRTNPKKAKPVKMTAGTAGLVDEESEGFSEVPPAPSGWAQPSVDDDTTAMDIDSPPQEKVDETPKASQTNGARGVPVEPHRAEWRAGDVNGVRTKSASPMREENPTKGQAAPQSSSVPKPNSFPTQHGGSEDTDDLRTSFLDFKGVEPFLNPTPTGLKDFNDLKSTLPFESKPSEQIPLEREQAPKFTPLQFPSPPVAPRLPPTVVAAGVRPNQIQFRKYAQDFYQYMDKWETFNNRILEHFANRQENFKARRQQRGAAWLDTSVGGDDPVLDYLRELEQDQIVQKQWASAYAEHQAKIGEFVKFKDQVK
ncbi:uncharacterized protein F4822DRAFT_431212 [Hypoxylon trugodes]|uniref:uncharacterized protein n=1 Tax=Hypoxylon trugodes TaxID=326681 RepID=UPI00218E1369|nr:uncharacterized protein F4822DRAFT_431212 [Hypoxylon trugodes]KAI1386341.1 hypothetical protein F4822DRAFT_431212 [Hypoxylon trugodes]